MKFLNRKIIVIGVVCLLLVVGSCFFIFRESKEDKLKKKVDSLINIEEVSDEFMEDYEDGIKEIEESDTKDKVLIIISEKYPEETYGATKVVEAPNHQYILQYSSVEEKDEAKKKLDRDSSLIVEENELIPVSEANVIDKKYLSWGISKMGIDDAMPTIKKYGKNNVVVAIIDIGFDLKLFDKYFPGRRKEFYDPRGYKSTTDPKMLNHGTHIAGTIAEATPSNVKLMLIQTGYKDNDKYFLDGLSVINAINHITYYKKADVINMSFGSYNYPHAVYQALEAAKNKNIIPVAAAGNEKTSKLAYPASLSNTVSIAAIKPDKKRADFSNYGSTIDFAAPGTDIVSINMTMSGTSMATPHAVAAFAILKTFNKNINKNEAVQLMRKITTDLGTTGKDNYYGYGLINFHNKDLCDNTTCDVYKVFKTKPANIAPKDIKVTVKNKKTYAAFTKVSPSDFNVHITYNNESEKDVSDYKIQYIDSRSNLRYGDKNVTFSYTSAGKTVTKKVSISVEKAKPSYKIPANLHGYVNEKLSTVILPDKFSWVKKNTKLTGKGKKTFKAIYTPKDTTNYKVVKDIDITVTIDEVKKTVIKPSIKVDNKIYDGEYHVPFKSIHISNLSSSDYKVYSTMLSSPEIGKRTLALTLKLTDEKFKKYSFEGGKQKATFNVPVQVISANYGTSIKSDHALLYFFHKDATAVSSNFNISSGLVIYKPNESYYANYKVNETISTINKIDNQVFTLTKRGKRLVPGKEWYAYDKYDEIHYFAQGKAYKVADIVTLLGKDKDDSIMIDFYANWE